MAIRYIPLIHQQKRLSFSFNFISRINLFKLAGKFSPKIDEVYRFFIIYLLSDTNVEGIEIRWEIDIGREIEKEMKKGRKRDSVNVMYSYTRTQYKRWMYRKAIEWAPYYSALNTPIS
jgi:hypothetical protein